MTTRYGQSLTAITIGALCCIACNRSEVLPEPGPDPTCLAHANRHERDGWIYLHVEGTPQARGYQHGYLMAKEIAEGLRVTGAAWSHDTTMEWSWLVTKAARLLVPRIDRENLAELDGIVEGMRAAGVESSRAELVAYNAIIELWGYWWPGVFGEMKKSAKPASHQSCSSFIATGNATTDGGVVLAHNTMGGYDEVLFNVIIDVLPAKGHRILMQTAPGWLHSGTDFFITDAGLVGAETTIGGFEGFDAKGTPEFTRMRRATQDASSIEEWGRIMRRGNNGGYANAWLVGDVNTGEIARLELGLKNVAFEVKRDGWFTGSNIAEDRKILRLETSVVETDIRRSAVARRVRWNELMSQFAGRIDLDTARRLVADHYDTYLGAEHPGQRSLCAHWELEGNPSAGEEYVPYEPTGTYDAKVVDTKMAKQMSFAARFGSACGMAFDAPKFLATHPQFGWMSSILRSRPTEPWTTFTAGEK